MIDGFLEAGIDMIIHCVFEDEAGRYAWRQDLADHLASADREPDLIHGGHGTETLTDAVEREQWHGVESDS